MYGRRMRNIVPPIVLAALCACASPLPAVDARLPNSDARADVDAAPGPDAGGGGSPDARAAVTMDVVCQPFTRTVVYADGTRHVVTTRYGIVDSIGPEDVFAVETCGLTYTPPIPACPAGATCTGSTDPGGTTTCVRSYRSGSFVDGKLSINCGQTFEYFGADGTPTSSGGYGYTNIRVITY